MDPIRDSGPFEKNAKKPTIIPLQLLIHQMGFLIEVLSLTGKKKAEEKY